MPKPLTPGAEPFASVACPRCERPLRFSESPGKRVVRCPGCGAALTAALAIPPAAALPPAPPEDKGAGAVPEARPSWLARSALPAPALLAVGIPLCTRGSVPGTGLAAGLALACVLLGLWRRWRPAVRLLLTLALMGLGYGVAFAVLLPEETDPAAGGSDVPGNWPMMSPPFASQGGFPGLPTHHPPNVQPVTDLTFRTHLGALLAVAVDPEAGAAFVTRADGSLDHYSYPDFRQLGKYRLEQPGYRAVLDGRCGRLFVAVSDPAALRTNRFGDRPVGRGDLHVYDVGDLLARGEPRAPAATPLRPAAVVPLGGDVSRLLAAPDRDALYYLVHRPDGDRVGRLPTSSPADEVRWQADGAVTALALSPDGAALYAAGPGVVRVLDPGTLEVRRSVAIEPTAFDLAADNGGRLFVTEVGQWTSITVVDSRQGETIGHWNPRMHGRIYLQVTPDATRLYLGTSAPISNSLHCWLVQKPGGAMPPQFSHAGSDSTGPVRGEFFITPDGRHLVNRHGKVFQLVTPAEQRAALPEPPP